jgi:predicted metal-dependent enzyme (double-stranded beta helix superfamily)
MTTQTENALERFVAKTRALFAKESDPEKRWTQMDPILAELLSDPEIIAASKKWPDCTLKDGRAENLLFYEDPDFKFVVNGLVVNEAGYGSGNRIHDHAHIYTLYGVLDGNQNIHRYERLDDRSKPDFAEIRPTWESACGPGEIDLVRPYEIHTETSLGERAVAIIIRSEKSGTFNQGRYVPDEKRYYESLGPRQTPIDIYNRTPLSS